MSTKKQGGKRVNAGRNPKWGVKGEPKKRIVIDVPERLHCELSEICKLAISKHLNK